MLQDRHPSDEELLLAGDGELPSRRAAQVRAHLSSCWHCRARAGRIESTIADFVRAYEDSGESFPPMEGPRALLKARLEESANSRPTGSWLDFRSAVAVLTVLTVAFGALVGLALRTRNHGRSNFVALTEPRFSLTPGAIRIATRDEICREGMTEKAALPASLKSRVFEEYGMSPGRNADAFEVDYLVTPELGGAADIRNLWPQPYASTVWNARVKDELEDRLHELVCSGEVDLATAQHDIATDWISAYKKYFHTDKPF
ncbi:hypothetical protein [Nevskia soli]|jgi:hypothetical protein|uniref:hypothetical protein n=1 Tax=Nevskia soli TaxID=418856 RepID=UPI001C5CAB56|nr:hypothetical protein [Nevskia soli]